MDTSFTPIRLWAYRPPFTKLVLLTMVPLTVGLWLGYFAAVTSK